MEVTDNDHARLVQREARGEVRVGVDRVLARRFYTDTPLPTILEQTGEKPYLEKGVVMTAFVAGPLFLIATLVLGIFVLRWWMILAGPAAVIGWALFYMNSPRGGARLAVISVLVLLAVALAVLDPLENRRLELLFVVYLIALWLTRFLYSASTAFLRRFVLRNARAYAWLKPDLVIRPSKDAAR
jgi:hypothetical protein